MFDTTEQMLEQIRAGEDGRAEFKELPVRPRTPPYSLWASTPEV